VSADLRARRSDGHAQAVAWGLLAISGQALGAHLLAIVIRCMST
jgi:hypothetical protein